MSRIEKTAEYDCNKRMSDQSSQEYEENNHHLPISFDEKERCVFEEDRYLKDVSSDDEENDVETYETQEEPNEYQPRRNVKTKEDYIAHRFDKFVWIQSE